MTGLLALRRLVLAIAGALAWAGPTLARLTVGWLFVVSGRGKLHDLDRVIDYFRELGIPHAELQAPFVAGTELVCGTLVLIGLFTRLAGVPLIVTMIVAIATAQKENVHGLADLFGLVEWCYVALLFWLAVAGAGPLSLDALLVRWAERHRPATRAVPADASLTSRAR